MRLFTLPEFQKCFKVQSHFLAAPYRDFRRPVEMTAP
jgi:hypothetical protein